MYMSLMILARQLVACMFTYSFASTEKSSTYIKAFPDFSNSGHYQMNLSPLTYGVIGV